MHIKRRVIRMAITRIDIRDLLEAIHTTLQLWLLINVTALDELV